MQNSGAKRLKRTGIFLQNWWLQLHKLMWYQCHLVAGAKIKNFFG
jgi:hypothetical protein